MKTYRHLLLQLVCIALFLAALSGGFVRSAFAQHHPVYSSLEADISVADDVYLGTIAEVGEPKPSEYGEPTIQVVIDVTETLKGEKRKRLPAIVFHDRDGGRLNAVREWSRKRTPLIGFIRRARSEKTKAELPENFASFRYVNPMHDGPNSELPQVGYFSMDFRLLRTSGEILDAVHRYAKIAPKTVRIHAFIYIPDLIRKQFPYATGGELLVPVVPQLETIARRMILTPASFIPAEFYVYGVSHEEYLAFKAMDEGRIRRIGVQALAHFPSKANIELLKRQLNDPFIEPWEDKKDGYYVRKFAFDILKKWGVNVAEPQLYPPSEDIK